jgi:hypothetical protein
MDNQIRHAITKLAHLHFASAEPHARRIAQMGEEAWRIHTVGGPGIDRIATTEALTREALARELDLPAGGPWLLVTFHPVTLEYRETASYVDELLAALEKSDGTLVITYPNADTSGQPHHQPPRGFALATGPLPARAQSRASGLSLAAPARRRDDRQLVERLIEAPSFGLPAVNIGARQRGRLRGANVIDVEPLATRSSAASRRRRRPPSGLRRARQPVPTATGARPAHRGGPQNRLPRCPPRPEALR